MSNDIKRRRRAKARRRFSLPNYVQRSSRLRLREDTERWLTLQCIAGYTDRKVSLLHAGVPKGLTERGQLVSELDLDLNGGRKPWAE